MPNTNNSSNTYVDYDTGKLGSGHTVAHVVECTGDDTRQGRRAGSCRTVVHGGVLRWDILMYP